ncbi:MAG: methyl-accepting chemotaxis protein [Schwartzia sp. (in: firmicutes)]
MNGLTVSKKIMLTFMSLIVIFAGFGGYAIYSARALNDSTDGLMEWTDSLAASSQIADAANEMRRAGIVRAMNTDPQKKAAMDDKVAKTRQKVEDAFTNYQKMVESGTLDDQEGRQQDLAILEAERKAWQAYLETGNKVDDLVRAGKQAEALTYIEGPSREAFQKFMDLILKDEERAMSGAQEEKADSDDAYGKVILGTVAAMVVVLLFTCACAYFLLSNIKTSVDRLLTALRKVAAGDLRLMIAVDSADEFGQMARQCNQVIETVRDVTKTIQKTAGTVSDSAETLTSTSGQSAQVTQGVAQSITEVAAAAQAQMESIAETKHQVQAFTNGLKEANHTIEGVVGVIDQTAQKAEEGNTIVGSTVEQMNTIADTTVSIGEAVANLGERSKEIGNIVEVISGISAQTNLLALNAAIEAARAGEHGRGFAVVAEEVRKLAEGSQNATQQIADLIHTIQQATDQAVATMAEGRSQAEKGRENVAATGRSFSEILRMIRQVQENSVLIEKTMGDLEHRAEKIDNTTAKIHDSASKVAAESQNVSAATEEQAAGMEEIAASTRSLSDMAADLNQAAARFKT